MKWGEAKGCYLLLALNTHLSLTPSDGFHCHLSFNWDDLQYVFLVHSFSLFLSLWSFRLSFPTNSSFMYVQSSDLTYVTVTIPIKKYVYMLLIEYWYDVFIHSGLSLTSLLPGFPHPAICQVQSIWFLQYLLFHCHLCSSGLYFLFPVLMLLIQADNPGSSFFFPHPWYSQCTDLFS